MDAGFDRSPFADEISSLAECDAPVSAWTLDELDTSADLGSFRSALAATDDFDA
jgi:hypothetical protein